MSISFIEALLYAGGIAILFLTPGPVWVALIARAVSGGFAMAWPLAAGVIVGDVLWPLLAIFGVSFLVEIYADFLIALRFMGAALLVGMGINTIRQADKPLVSDERLTTKGKWAGFIAGLMVIMGNPKAVLFYMGVLPGFFDIQTLNGADILVICSISALVPFAGNVFLALSVEKMRAFLSSPNAVRRTNQVSGAALILVGLAIAVLG